MNMVGPKVSMILQKYTDVADDMGGNTRTWYSKCMLSGSMVSLSGRERMAWGQVAEVSVYRFTTNYPIGFTITAKDRLNKDGRIFEILGVDNPGEQNRFIQLTIKEIVVD